jgi:capsular polysaccharide biosynthesis protein
MAEDDEISLLDLLQTIADNIRLLVLAPLAAGLLALGISFALPPTFTAQTVIMPPQQQQGAAAAMLQSLGALGGLAGAAGGLKNPNDQYIAMLKSRTVQDAMVKRFELQERWELDYQQDARTELDKNARISSGKDGLITIMVDDESAHMAADMANAYVEELTKIMGRLAITEAQQRRAFFETKLKESQTQLVAAEQALRSTGVSADLLKTQPQSAVAGVAELEARISAQEVKLASMRGYLADSAPEFRQAQTELAAMRQQQAKFSKVDVNGANSNYIQRYRDFKYQETLSELFAKQYEIARIDEAREGPLVQVVDAAQPPERKSKPKKALIAVMVTLATGFALLLFVFVRAAIRNSVSDSATAAKWQAVRRSFGFRS